MKNLIKISSILTVVLMLLVLVSPVGAVTYDLDLEAVRVGSSGIALRLSPEPEAEQGYRLFDLSNMNPGDRRTAEVKFTNSFNRAVDLHVAAVDPSQDPVEEGEQTGLLDKLRITIRRGTTVLYVGPLAGMPLFGSSQTPIVLGRYSRSTQPVILEFEVYLPGPETGNEYQGKSADISFIFGVDPVKGGGGGGGGGDDWYYYEPEPPAVSPEEELVVTPEAPGVKPDMPKTGVEVPYVYYLLGGLALFGGLKLVRKPKRR